MIQEWADITLAAIERKMIKQSPQAYFMHYINEAAEKRTTPPDWWQEQRKREFLDQQKKEGSQHPKGESEEVAFQKYLEAEGKAAFDRVMQRLIQNLTEAGQSETDARYQARNSARLHVRKQFQAEHPVFQTNGPTMLGNLIRQRLDNDKS